MDNEDQILTFWNKVKQDRKLEASEKYFDAFSFGDSKELADELIQLILEGKKTTTTGLVVEYQLNNWKLPHTGDKIVVLDGDQFPKCVIEYSEVEYIEFSKMSDVKFAQDEGEGFDTLDIWRDVHKRYFSRVLMQAKYEFREDLKVIKIRFKLIYP